MEKEEIEQDLEDSLNDANANIEYWQHQVKSAQAELDKAYQLREGVFKLIKKFNKATNEKDKQQVHSELGD